MDRTKINFCVEYFKIIEKWNDELQRIKERAVPLVYFINKIAARYQVHVFSNASLEVTCLVARFRVDCQSNANIFLSSGNGEVHLLGRYNFPG